jgi:hypothetical protein
MRSVREDSIREILQILSKQIFRVFASPVECETYSTGVIKNFDRAEWG